MNLTQINPRQEQPKKTALERVAELMGLGANIAGIGKSLSEWKFGANNNSPVKGK